MTNIKVTVTYEQPTTTKFDALMAEYVAAKKVADETVAYYKPLADAAEEAKFDAIMDQLQTIKTYAKRLSALYEDREARITAYIGSSQRGSCYTGGLYFKVIYSPVYGDIISWNDADFSKDSFKRNRGSYTSDGYNIIGKWDEWEVYKGLEKDACRQLNAAIEAQTRRAQKQVDRLSNVVDI